MTTSVEEADEIMGSEYYDFLQMDEQYAIDELNKLENEVKNGFVAETTKYEFNLPKISTREIKDIIGSLSDMKNEIRGRVVPVE